MLRDSRVSRRHARLVLVGGRYCIEDMESLHGVRVNGTKVLSQELHLGDSIDFGLEDGYRLVFGEKSEAEIRRLLGRFSNNSELSKLRALTEVARSLEHALSTHEVLATVIEAALTVTGCERGFLLLEKDGRLVAEVGRDQNGATLRAEDLTVPPALIARALRERKELLSFQFDPLSDWSGRFNDSLDGLDLRSVLCIPLLRLRGNVSSSETLAATMDDTIGVIYMDSRIATLAHEQGNRELLQTLALEASTILENARLLEEERARQRLDAELALARSIQANLLPRHLPQSGFLRATGSSIPTRQVGGDFYEVLRQPDGSWMAAVADVSGKGVAAALLASLLQGVLLEAASSGASLEAWLGRLNRFLLERTDGEKYATLFACRMQADGLLQFVNAGHSRPFVLHPRAPGGPTLSVLDANGFPAGLLPEATFELNETRLQPGDRVVLFSDGVEEARHGSDFFGRQRIAAALTAGAGLAIEELEESLRQALTVFLEGTPLHDDATVLILEYTAQSASSHV